MHILLGTVILYCCAIANLCAAGSTPEWKEIGAALRSDNSEVVRRASNEALDALEIFLGREGQEASVAGVVNKLTEALVAFPAAPNAELLMRLQQLAGAHSDSVKDDDLMGSLLRSEIACCIELAKLGKTGALTDAKKKLDLCYSRHPDTGAKWHLIAQLEKRFIDACRELMPAEVVQRLERLKSAGVPILAQAAASWSYWESLRENPLDMSFTAIDGRSVNASDLRGKIVLLVFSGIRWCHGCRLQEPFVKDVFSKLRQSGFEVVTVCFEKTADFETERQEIAAAIAQRGCSWPHYLDGKGGETRFVKQFGITAVPSHFLFGRDGRLVRDCDDPALYDDALFGTVAELLSGSNGAN